jgi:predicted O-methyltransferase YrrM
MIEHIYEQIPGWFTFPKFYKAMIERLPQKAHVLELGTYKGKSFSYLLIEAINSGKDIAVDGLDGFGWEDVRPAFDSFMKPFEKHYQVYSGNAVELAGNFPDKSLDFVFIDLIHTKIRCGK